MNWIVLVGAPAVGKSTLAAQLGTILEAKLYSFDEEFPLDKLKEDPSCDSKDCRGQLIEMILSDPEHTEWIIVDDTCHLKSMQKRYLLTSEKSSKEIKIVFLYISARLDQISDLQERNKERNSAVTNEEIDRLVKRLNAEPPEFGNIIEYNYTEIPKIQDLITNLNRAFKNYTRREFEVYERDIVSDESIFNQINLALTKEISAAFKRCSELDGKAVSVAKKNFLTVIRNRSGPLEIESIVKEFKAKYLNI